MGQILPNRAKAILLEKQMREGLHRSLLHLFEVAAELVSVADYKNLIQKLKKETEENHSSPFLYAFNARLIALIQLEEIQKVKALLLNFLNDDFTLKKYNIISLSEILNNPFLEDLFVHAVEMPAAFSKSNAQKKDPIKFDALKQKLIAAIQLIEQAIPDFYTEIHIFLKTIVIFETKDFSQGSCFSLFGLFHIPQHYETLDQIDLIDCILHEVAHLYIYAISAQDPLILNAPTERYPSPLRQDLRPLMGVFHAHFVLARITLALRELQASKMIKDTKLQQKITPLMLDYKKRCLGSYETIKSHGKLTPLGQIIFDSTKLPTNKAIKKAA